MNEKSSEKKREIKPFDFRTAKQVPETQLESIRGIYEGYVNKLSSTLSSNYRITVDAKVISVHQGTFEEFRSTLQTPALIGIIDMSPMRGEALIEVSPNLVFNFIDRLLGGRGELITLTRPLTDVEMKLVEKILQEFVDELKVALSDIVYTEPKLTGIVINPQFAQITANSDICISGTFEIKIGDVVGTINFCAPSAIIKGIMDKLHRDTKGIDRKSIQQLVSSPEDREKMQKLLKTSELSFIVTLGKIESTASEIMNLQVGDVIRLKTKINDDLIVTIGGVPKFACKPGRVGSNIGVEIVRILKTS
jgi:flagellar motor switch protein FliM